MLQGEVGLGKAIARQLAKEGVEAAICPRNLDFVQQTADELMKGRTVVPFAVNLQDPAAIQTFIDEASARFDGLDILVNNGARVSGGYPKTWTM